MTQASLFPNHIDTTDNIINIEVGSFSHNCLNTDEQRIILERKYKSLFDETEKFNRKIVSFQANKTNILHSWIKYREGFAAELVEILLNEFKLQPNDTLLDPFAGSCTSLIVAKLFNINAIGIELLPHCHLAWEAKSNVFNYDIDELQKVYDIINKSIPPNSTLSFSHLKITESAFPTENEKALLNYVGWFESMNTSKLTKLLLNAILMSILEEISYTRKDGQYLRWDYRSLKIINRNRSRLAKGKKQIKGIDKGPIPDVKTVLLQKLRKIINDIIALQKNLTPDGTQRLIYGNTLYELPLLDSGSIDGVITSPPYANRYDYTRTYALELAFLNIGKDIFSLRQNLLSCTVENKPKTIPLKEFYKSINRKNDYSKILNYFQGNKAVQEVIASLKSRYENGDMNNRGVLPMIEQYFMELTFVFFELYRTSKCGAKIAFVNDNVRYGGEVIPVDTITTNLAEDIGFIPEKIYVLPQRKGNSSQQMRKFGRRELRKSITIWKKE